MVKCRKGQLVLWREMRAEAEEVIEGVLNEIFLERGPVDEMLMDNSATFCSKALKRMLDGWKNVIFKLK